MAAIIELCVEYGRESDPSEKQNILRTLEEIASDRGLEVPNQTIEEFESRLAQTDKNFRAEFDLEEERIRTFKKKYFLQKAKAGLSTQSAGSPDPALNVPRGNLQRRKKQCQSSRFQMDFTPSRLT